MRKLLSFIIVCIPLYVWGSESFSVNLSLYETPRYAMNTSYDDRYSPILQSYKSPSAVDSFLEGVGGGVGGFAGVLVGWSGGPGLGGMIIVASLGYLFGIPAGVAITGEMLGYKGSYWKSFLGTALGTTVGIVIAGVAVKMTPIHESVCISVPVLSVVGAVWGYHLGGPSH